MSPKKVFVSDYGGEASVPVGTTAEQAAELLGIPGSVTGNRMHVAAFNGHQFEVRQCLVSQVADRSDGSYAYIRWSTHDDGQQPHEQSMEIKYPIDPRMILSDVEGAASAKHNADGTAWVFHHCDEDYMRDRESLLVAALTDAFAPMHRQLSRKLQRLELDNIVERFKDCLLYTSPSPRDS